MQQKIPASERNRDLKETCLLKQLFYRAGGETTP
jgi:hypothetical protein